MAKESTKLPFNPKYIESLLHGTGGRNVLSLNEKVRIMRSTVTKAEIDKPIYTNIRGPLKELSKRLKEVAKRVDVDDYNVVLREWAATILHGVMSYSNSKIKAAARSIDEYKKLYDRYELTFKRAFIADDVNPENNYENLEYLGDGVYKNALVFYIWREMGIQDKSYATEMKHSHENTKALAQLAKIFQMTPLIRSAGSRHREALHEDVFESFLGVFQEMQWQIQRDPSTPEAAEFAADSGFANRLVRLVFENSDYPKDYSLPSKTFMSKLKNTFKEGDETLAMVENLAVTPPTITLRCSQRLVNQIAGVFGADSGKLFKIFNHVYVAEYADAYDKFFVAATYSKIESKLATIGINQDRFMQYMNRFVVPRELRDLLDQVFVMAENKGYTLNVNVPRSKNTQTSMSAYVMFYCHDASRASIRAIRENFPIDRKIENFEKLLRDALDKISSVKVAPRKIVVADDPDDEVEEVKKPTLDDVNIATVQQPTFKNAWVANASTSVVKRPEIVNDASVAGDAKNVTVHKRKDLDYLFDVLCAASEFERFSENVIYSIPENPDRKNALLNALSGGKVIAIFGGRRDEHYIARLVKTGDDFVANLSGIVPENLKSIFVQIGFKLKVLNVESIELKWFVDKAVHYPALQAVL